MPAAAPHRLHHLRLQLVARYMSESEEILDRWDGYSERHTDADGWPHDPTAYGLRAARRDAETWHAFERIRSDARQLLATAETQIQQLPASAVNSRWAWQLATLREALRHLDALQAEYLRGRDLLPPSAVPGTEAYDDVVSERNDEAWDYLNTWAVHGQCLLDIDAATREAPPAPAGLAAVRTPLPPTGRQPAGPGRH